MTENDWIGEVTLDLIYSARKTSQNQNLNSRKEPTIWGSGQRMTQVENKSKTPQAGMNLLCLEKKKRYEEEVLHQIYQDQECATSGVPIWKKIRAYSKVQGQFSSSSTPASFKREAHFGEEGNSHLNFW